MEGPMSKRRILVMAKLVARIESLIRT